MSHAYRHWCYMYGTLKCSTYRDKLARSVGICSAEQLKSGVKTLKPSPSSSAMQSRNPRSKMKTVSDWSVGLIRFMRSSSLSKFVRIVASLMFASKRPEGWTMKPSADVIKKVSSNAFSFAHWSSSVAQRYSHFFGKTNKYRPLWDKGLSYYR